MDQAPTLVALALPRTVSLHRVRMSGAVLLPIAGVMAAPLAGTLATDLAVLGVGDQLAFAVVGAAVLLAGWRGAHRLLRMGWGGLELLVAITAAPLNHPNSVKAFAAYYCWQK